VEDRGSITGRVREYVLLHRVQTYSTGQTVSYSMNSENISPGIEWAKSEADCSPPFTVAFKNVCVELYVHSTIHLHDVIVKHREKAKNLYMLYRKEAVYGIW
jgi:hypothetical protein